MRLFCLVIALAFVATTASDSWGQSKQPSPSNKTQLPSAADQRGTDQVPLTVKILPTPDTKEQADKAEHDRKEKSVIDEKVAFETQRIADYTSRLAWFTLMLFGIAVLQAGLFFWQLRYMRKSMEDATIAAKAAQVSAETAKEQVAVTKMGVIDLERAYLAVGPTSITKTIDFDLQAETSEWETVVKILVHNTGRTGAVITNVYGEFSKDAPQGDSPVYIDGSNQETDLSIGANKESVLPIQFSDNFGDPQFFWGYVEYLDIFKNTRISRFCTLIIPEEAPSHGKYNIAGSIGWREGT